MERGCLLLFNDGNTQIDQMSKFLPVPAACAAVKKRLKSVCALLLNNLCCKSTLLCDSILVCMVINSIAKA